MTHPTGAPVSSERRSKRRRSLSDRLQTNGAAIVVATIFALLGGALLFQDPDRVPQLTVDNPSPYNVRVEVSDGDRAEWTALSTVRQHCNATIESPVDQGDTWVFRLHVQGVAAEEIEVARADLERAGWQFSIAPSVVSQWEADGIPHPPQQSC